MTFPFSFTTVSAVSKQHSLKALNKIILYIVRTICKIKVPLRHTFIEPYHQDWLTSAFEIGTLYYISYS